MNNPLNYQNQAVLKRYCTDNNIAFEIGKDHFKGLLHFLFICSKTKYPCYPSSVLDEVWHTFILFTKDYYDFCNNYFDRFIHHFPMDDNLEIKKGYYCYIDESTGKFVKKLVKNRQGIIECGSDGNCNSGGVDGNCSNV